MKHLNKNVRVVIASLIGTVTILVGRMSGATADEALPVAELGGISLVSNTKDLKDLLAAPLHMAECIGEVLKYSTTAGVTSTNHYYVLFRWQTNAFFYREMPTLRELFSKELKPGFRFFGRYEGNYWNYQEDPGMVISTTPDASKNVAHGVESAFRITACPILNFGVFDCPPGILNFEGDRLLVFTNGASVRVSGELQRSVSKQVSGLQFDLELPSRKIPWMIDYAYDQMAGLPSAVPREASISISSPAGWEAKSKIKYHRVMLTRSTLPKQFFRPAQFIGKGIIEVMFIKNQPSYWDASTGEFKPAKNEAHGE